MYWTALLENQMSETNGHETTVFSLSNYECTVIMLYWQICFMFELIRPCKSSIPIENGMRLCSLFLITTCATWLPILNPS